MFHASSSDPPEDPFVGLLKQQASYLGFDVCRLTSPTSMSDAISTALYQWLAEGFHGDMDWMQTTRDRRQHPLALWPETKSIIMLGINYGRPQALLDDLNQPHLGYVSLYARYRDYHQIIKKKLLQLAEFILADSPEETDLKFFVDTAPVMEKPLAAAAGLGWQGKHTNLVSREFGSFLFLAALFTTRSLPTDPPSKNLCGSCTACLDICPTRAFVAPYVLDARRCISYLTIEHKGHIPRHLRKGIGNRIYGCDDCLAVCPWNKFATTGHDLAKYAQEHVHQRPLDALLRLDDSAFRQLFSQNPIKRIGYARFLRNVLIAIGNSDHKEYIPSIVSFLSHPLPLLRAAAIWALKRLSTEEMFQYYADRYSVSETDPLVQQEWN